MGRLQEQDAVIAPLHVGNPDVSGASDVASRDFCSYLGIASVAMLSAVFEAWSNPIRRKNPRLAGRHSPWLPHLSASVGCRKTSHDYRERRVNRGYPSRDIRAPCLPYSPSRSLFSTMVFLI